MKKLFVVVLVILLAAMAVSVAVVVQRLKPLLERELRAALQTPVKVGSLGWVPPVGVRVRSVEAENPPGFSPQPWLRAGAVDVRLAVWSLVRRPLVVDVALLRPELFVEQLSDGRLNLPKTSPPAPVPSAGAAQPQQKPAALPRQLRLRQGRLTYLDRRLNPSGVEWQLDQVKVDAQAVLAPPAYRYRAAGIIQIPGVGPSGEIRFEGRTTLDQRTEATLEVTHRALAQVSPYLQQALGVGVTDGEARLRAAIRGEGEQAAIQVHVELLHLAFASGFVTNLGISAQRLVELLQDGTGRIQLDFTITGRWDKLQVDWDELMARALEQAFQNAMARELQQTVVEGLTTLIQPPAEGEDFEDRLKAMGDQLKRRFKGAPPPAPDDASQKP